MSGLSSVSIHNAKAHFSELIEWARQGREVIITKTGLPVARLLPYIPRRKIAPPGGMEGKGYWIALDFDSPIDDISK